MDSEMTYEDAKAKIDETWTAFKTSAPKGTPAELFDLCESIFLRGLVTSLLVGVTASKLTTARLVVEYMVKMKRFEDDHTSTPA
jgi:hypothetical protein